MLKPCKGCPFEHKECEPRGARWKEIKDALLTGAIFWCHETTVQDEENEDEMRETSDSLVCAGSLEFQKKHRVMSQYEQVCERLNVARGAREQSQTRSKERTKR